MKPHSHCVESRLAVSLLCALLAGACADNDAPSEPLTTASTPDTTTPDTTSPDSPAPDSPTPDSPATPPPDPSVAVPAAPTLALDSTGSTTLDFTWSNIADATQFQMQYNLAGAGWVNTGNAIVAGSTATSLSRPVAVPRWDDAQYRLQACNAGGCSSSNPIDVAASLSQAIGYIKASYPDINDRFGQVVAVSADGNTMAVGAMLEDGAGTGVDGEETSNTAESSGAVYVFVRSATGWLQQAYLKASNAEAYDAFGQNISLSADGSTLAVSAPNEASNATGINGDQSDNSALMAGAVYVFVRTGSDWAQQAYVKASNTGQFDVFGQAIALSSDGNTLAVSANREASNAQGIDGDQNNDLSRASGAAYVYTRTGSTWLQQAYIKASNAGQDDFFGVTLALSGDGTTLAVGAFGEASNATGIQGDQLNDAARLSGAVYVFQHENSGWSQQAYIKSSNSAAEALFGSQVALSDDGSTLAVGATGEDNAATGINGDQNNGVTSDSGAVYMFTRNNAIWAQQAYIKASNAGASDRFGLRIALSGDGNTLVATATGEDSNATGINGDELNDLSSDSGAAYLFRRNNASWTQQAYIKASNTGAGDWFGTGLALSGDITTLAIGAVKEDSHATGVNGNQSDESTTDSGAVYLY